MARKAKDSTVRRTPAPLRAAARASTLRLCGLAAAGALAYSGGMSSERAYQAMERIERAITRLEQAASGHRPAQAEAGELQQLREVHQALRGQVEGAIAQIDRLLANGGGM